METKLGLSVNPAAKAIIFDVDGTLIDTMPWHFKAWQEVGRLHGFEYPEEVFYRYAGMPTYRVVALINDLFGYQLDIEQINREKNDAYMKYVSMVRPIEPVVRIAREYHGKLPMALGTGEYKYIAMANIKAAGLEEYFSTIVTADDVQNHKPDPETFLACARLLHVSPEDCHVFEDAEPGLEAARHAGMMVTDVRPYLK